MAKETSALLEKTLEKAVALPANEHDAIVSQILAVLAGEEGWKSHFGGNRDALRNMADEAIEEDERGETQPLEDLL